MKSPSQQETEAVQLGKLQRLAQEIIPANRFYAQKLQAPASQTPWMSIGDFQASVPFTTKHEIVKDQLANAPYGSNLTYSLERYARCHQTSGSTAVPIRWLDTKESWDLIVGAWIQILQKAGVRGSDRFFFAFSFGPFLGFWSAIEAVHRLGCFCFSGGGMSSAARVQAILDNGITVLCCTPTYAQHLGEVAKARRLDLAASRVRQVIVAGEAGGSIPATRARLENLWPGASVFDHHGMTEVGPVTYQCPAEPGVLHVLESAYLPEVIHPVQETAVPSGSRGELVLTTLDRVGSPLLRYRTGDLVKARARAQCLCDTWDLALEGGIIGRADDMVVVRGVNIYPSLVEEIMRREPAVAEYRVTVDSRGPMAECSLDFEPFPECEAPALVQQRLQEVFQNALHLRVPVAIVPPGSLPRYEMKARRWVRLTEGVV
jgi:phenylacetate-CoA ligase